VERVPSPGPPPGPLSEREREVAELLAQRLTHRAVAERLGISVPTVRAYIAHACLELGLRGGGRALAAWVAQNPR
jgi:DNA-binding CsgD family transcriptional regulator